MPHLFWSLAAMFSVLGFFFWEAWTESQERLAELKRTEKLREDSVNELERQKDLNAVYLDRVQDREFLLREVRQRLGYVANPGEVVIQVEQSR
jgi:cell division protein FtsB